MTEDDNKVLIRHEPCPNCQSMGRDQHGDNLARYADGHAYCYSCGQFFPPEAGTKQHEEKPLDKASLFSSSSSSSSWQYKQLKKRRISAETCKRYKYAVGNNQHRATYYTQSGQEIYKYRSCDKKFFWTKNDKKGKIQLFGQQLWPAGVKRLVITEGELDALSVAEVQQCQYPVVSVPTGAGGAVKAIQDNLEWVSSFERVTLAFDGDDVGQRAAKAVAEMLPVGTAYTVTYPEGAKDFSDLLQQDRGTEIIDTLWRATVYRPDGIHCAGDEIAKLLSTPPTVSYYVDIAPKLMEATQGVAKGEIWMLTAGSGIGKSTLAHEMLYALHHSYNLKIGIIALEESPRYMLSRWLSIHLNKKLNSRIIAMPESDVLSMSPDELIDHHLSTLGLTRQEQADAANKLFSGNNVYYYDHWGSIDRSTLLSRIRYMAVSLQCDFILLDHISIVVSGLKQANDSENERQTIDRLMTDLRSLVEHTGVGLICISHLKRPQPGRRSYNKGGEVEATALRGSGALEQLSDVVIGLERNQQVEEANDKNGHITATKSQIRLLKNRPAGATGIMDTLIYDRETGRLKAEAEPKDPLAVFKPVEVERAQQTVENENNEDDF